MNNEVGNGFTGFIADLIVIKYFFKKYYEIGEIASQTLFHSYGAAGIYIA